MLIRFPLKTAFLTFAPYLILLCFRHLGCDLIHESSIAILLLIGGGAFPTVEPPHRLTQFLQLLLVKKPLPGYQAGTEGKVLLGAPIVFHIVIR